MIDASINLQEVARALQRLFPRNEDSFNPQTFAQLAEMNWSAAELVEVLVAGADSGVMPPAVREVSGGSPAIHEVHAQRHFPQTLGLF